MGLIIIPKTDPEFSPFYTIQMYIIPSALNAFLHLSNPYIREKMFMLYC